MKERREHESGLPAIPMCTGDRGVQMNYPTEEEAIEALARAKREGGY